MATTHEVQSIFIACPTHDGRIDARTAKSIYQTASQKHSLVISVQASSLLTHNCNGLWCAALNMRTKHNLKWFAMIHSDVIPEPFWLDKLVDIAEHHKADMLSVVIPIKSPDGITSTAISKAGGTGVFKRLTQTEVLHPQFPETFDINAFINVGYHFLGSERKLLVNTGCMIVRIDQLWSDEVYFTINDQIDRQFGTYVANVEPEDWFFSRMVAEKGGRVMATKAIQVTHMGSSGYNSHAVWGKAVDTLAEQNHD